MKKFKTIICIVVIISVFLIGRFVHLFAVYFVHMTTSCFYFDCERTRHSDVKSYENPMEIITKYCRLQEKLKKCTLIRIWNQLLDKNVLVTDVDL